MAKNQYSQERGRLTSQICLTNTTSMKTGDPTKKDKVCLLPVKIKNNHFV